MTTCHMGVPRAYNMAHVKLFILAVQFELYILNLLTVLPAMGRSLLPGHFPTNWPIFGLDAVQCILYSVQQ